MDKDKLEIILHAAVRIVALLALTFMSYIWATNN